ncbi:MAG: cytochrome b/b6 domain-containing protein [Deltaproteobacteria bacterium]|nr:cytochrome b/b6 domain-containing protein [Deltaproteobacteria bacterium]
MPEETWDRGTRSLHWGLSLAVTFQLFSSLVLEVPQPGLRPQPFGRLAFQAHEGVGVALIALVLAHWLWTLRRGSGQAARHLFPWGRVGRAEIAADLRHLKAGRLPEGGPRGGLAGFVHGLGFLAVSGMAALGGLLLLLSAAGSPLSLLHNVAGVHATLADVVWFYWLGHAAMAAVHESRGHRVLSGIFRL